MKVVAYLRVSTDRQAEKGLGLDVQDQAIKKWARANKHKIVATFTDEGVSGSNGIDTRDELPEALAALKDRAASGLVVYRLDRLARDLIVQETLLAEIRRVGAEVFTTSTGEQHYLTDDPDDPSRKLIRQVLGAVAEYERSMIRLRMRAGRRRKAEKGGYAYGSPPYGWQSIGGELVEVEGEQKTLSQIRTWRAEGMSIAGIAERLNDAGIAARKGRWHATTVARALQRSRGSGNPREGSL